MWKAADKWKVVREAIGLATVLYELDEDGNDAKDQPGFPYVEYNVYEFERHMDQNCQNQPYLMITDYDRYTRLVAKRRKDLLSLRAQPQLPMETIGGNDD